MYILLVSVAVKHVLDEVLDHVTHITQYFIINTTHGLRYCTISFILALSTHAVVSSAEFVMILFFHQLFINCHSIGPGIQSY